MPNIERMMPEASDNSSQPCSSPFRGCEMAGMGLPSNNLACPWVGDMGCVCPLPTRQGCICVVSLHQPFRNTQRRFCMAGYHCLMPTAFLLLQHNTNLTGIGISLIKTRFQPDCLSAFLRKNKKPQHLVWNRHCG